MSWLLDPGGKSVAHRAQKVVNDMHLQLERQNRHIQDLEQIVATLQKMCTDPIEIEIKRLEHRKIELQRELEHTEELITQYKKVALDTKLQVTKVLNREKQFSYNVAAHYPDTLEDRTSVDSSIRSSNSDTIARSRGRSRDDGHAHHEAADLCDRLQHDDASSGDEQFEEEFELIANVKRIEPQMIFLIHRNSSEDIVVYVPPRQHTDPAIISSYRLRDHTDKNSCEELTYFEKMMAYGPKIIPNHDRDEPDIQAMIYTGASSTSQSFDHIGDLVCAIELPAVPDIRLDIWKSVNDDRYWATTTIQGVKFAVLERIYVMSEVRWGFQTVVGMELAGRHPISGKVVTEMVNETP